MKKIILTSLFLILLGCASKPVESLNRNLDLDVKTPPNFDSKNSYYKVPESFKVYWLKAPSLTISGAELAGRNRLVLLEVKADEWGVITEVVLTRSSGLAELDEKSINAVKLAKLKPYKINGKHVRFDVTLPLLFTLEN
ncbi:energy transducer TonB [Acinetobacter pittii]|uniref:energy transducer TonB n=1 Tax=Acinetobacter pittii TaxID=48296 RepID=UPI001022E494|nr:energy transducer TonB [Acinetobacter pittii]RZG82851.1 energy transducer TonB [Acinetobacter pittii]RZH57812.1 energy transducer TonB [Acinetobacter pittii]RZH60400.1 energy transducer TonB [Acinetobacter pittii]